MDKQFQQQFASPTAEYRGAPFWAWNGKLEPDELRRQIRLMHHMGLGGFFMHSRVGLDTPYLSDEWFDCVRACIDEAEQLGMKAWLYDEDRWPSGAAGGLVTRDPKHRQKLLVLQTLPPGAQADRNETILAEFAAKVDGNALSGVRRLDGEGKSARPGKDEYRLRFRIASAPCRDWFNGQAYLDTLSHEAVQAFIEATHERYRQEIADAFGGVVPGIFTDEPNHTPHNMNSGSSDGRTGTMKELSAPWAMELPETFRQRYGYDIIDHLPELFYDVDGQEVSQARWHYHDCTTHMFVDAFARQIGEWCEANGIMHTGHVLQEDKCSDQANRVGSAMRFYEYMQAPGMDLLTARWRVYDTAKQVSSVARQTGRQWRLTETYGCTGWDFPFAGHKSLGDWQAALGINFRCQHLAWYTMLGEAKRDYPASISYQSPWWEYYAKVEDYFGRVNVATTQGQEVRDLLVIHPVESAWVQCRRDWRANGNLDVDTDMMVVRDSLLNANIDFDYGDEEMLSRLASVDADGASPLLRVGEATYTTVLVPPMTTIRSTTVKLLDAFRAAGGSVVFAGSAPRYVDALSSPAARDLAGTCVRTSKRGAKLVAAVESARRVSIADEAGQQIAPALYMLREDDDAHYLFVCNTGHHDSDLSLKKPDMFDPSRIDQRTAAFEDVTITVFTTGKGQPIELDAETGETFAADARRTDDGWQIRTSLPQFGSRLFLLPKNKASRKPAPRPSFRETGRKTLSGDWNYALSEGNCLVLDRPQYRMGGKRWTSKPDVLSVDTAVRQSLGIPARGGQMVQPWAREPETDPKTAAVELRYTFEVKAIPSGELFLCIERPDLYDIRLNDQTICTDADCGWWVDQSLRRLPISPMQLRPGVNEIRLRTSLSAEHPGLEMIYLLGSFGVKVRGSDACVTPLPDKLKVGNWTQQGLAFYSGSVCYRRKIATKRTGKQRLIVRVPDYAGVAVRVLVDGQQAGIIGWQPNEVDITDFMTGEKAELGIEVLGHRRNSHGPLHLKERFPVWTGPGQFTDGKDQWVENYQLVSCGLLKSPQLITREG